MAKTTVHSVERIIGSRVKMHRQREGFTQTALGKHLDISFQQIQKYENGSNRLSAARLFQIAHFLHIPVSELVMLDKNGPATRAKNVARFAKTSEAKSLMRAYLSIRNPSVRHHVLGLVETLGR